MNVEDYHDVMFSHFIIPYGERWELML